MPFRGVISSSGSCHVKPGKHRLLQHSRISPVSPAWHGPEAECGSPNRCKGKEEEQVCPKIGQSISNRGSDTAIFETIASLPGFMLAFEEPVAYCRVWVPTFEQERQSDAWSGCLSTRSHRRDYCDCR